MAMIRARRVAAAAAIALAIACAGVTVAKVGKPPHVEPTHPPHPTHPAHPLTPNWSPPPFGGTPLPRPSPTAAPNVAPPVIILPDTAGE